MVVAGNNLVLFFLGDSSNFCNMQVDLCLNLTWFVALQWDNFVQLQHPKPITISSIRWLGRLLLRHLENSGISCCIKSTKWVAQIHQCCQMYACNLQYLPE
uniref:Uncharacterized protein n=2 Tax=Nicotiana TaxID=4085 RepID=A0A1S4ATC8_TOBAC|nr:PREDICTED: uncharacterized protein LOC104215327 [Nicotiana sylvestris]XP_016479939.1 PREDICTED: uncharacterized protein LOC107801169 [Nicotiana tabacum]